MVPTMAGPRTVDIMRDAVIVGAVRTPVGRRNGGLAGVHPVDLSAHVLRALAERTGFDPADVEDVVWGMRLPGRRAVLEHRPQRGAGGRLAGVGARHDARPAVRVEPAGAALRRRDRAVRPGRPGGGRRRRVDEPGADGLAARPRPGSVRPGGPRERYGAAAFNQGVGAEMIAERWGFSRRPARRVRPGQPRRGGQGAGRRRVRRRDRPVAGVTADEGIRRDTTLEKLAGLKTPFKADGVVTAGSASQISDGAAALAVTTSRWAAAHGLRPLARVHTAVVAADDPVIMLTAPIPATAKALAKAGLTLDDIGVYEVNEAFAPVPLAWLAETGADPARLNPRGGAIALGHPLGASGARIMTTMLHHMRQNGHPLRAADHVRGRRNGERHDRRDFCNSIFIVPSAELPRPRRR